MKMTLAEREDAAYRTWIALVAAQVALCLHARLKRDNGDLEGEHFAHEHATTIFTLSERAFSRLERIRKEQGHDVE